MDLEKKSSAFEKIHQYYLKQLSDMDLGKTAHRIGADMLGDEIILPFFNKPYRVSKRGIFDPMGNEPIHAIKIVLCKYLLLYPAFLPKGNDWVSYRDFKDSAPFVEGFQNNSEKAVAKHFTGRLEKLKKACLKLGAYHPLTEFNYDLKMQFHSLINIPVLLLFNDADTEFPAQCLILFEHRAEKYLDVECIAIIGWLLSDYLISFLYHERNTIM